MLETHPPVKTFRGTLAEVLSHQDEVPEGAVVELRIYASQVEEAGDAGAFGGKNVADIISEVGFIETSGPSDMGRHPEKYSKGVGG